MLFSQPGAIMLFQASLVFQYQLNKRTRQQSLSKATMRRTGEVRDVPNVEVFVWSRCCWRKINHCAWFQVHVLLATLINSLYYYICQTMKEECQGVEHVHFKVESCWIYACVYSMFMFCAPIMFRQSVCDPRYQQCCRIHCWRGVWTFSCTWWKLPHVLPYSDSVPTHRDLVVLTSSILTHPLVAW